MLRTGSPAPELELADTEGRTVRLAGFRGEAVLLYFMRSTSCPVCRRHVRDLAEHPPGDVRVLVVVPDDRATAAAWRAKHRIPFPVLTGRGSAPHEVIGLSRALFGTVQRSGSVLVDAEGVVRHAHGATLPTGSYDKEGIATAVAALHAPA
ncbi:peroxiredoxin family protein [Amycolatopsis sp. NEAU-NG30]|uniref:thioredoxin-dependent peroxiredoxin n=1 Tax=Amycolatopsis melonis TaxID=3156488 RepID=A0ABV0L949_9PSEU